MSRDEDIQDLNKKLQVERSNFQKEKTSYQMEIDSLKAQIRTSNTEQDQYKRN